MHKLRSSFVNIPNLVEIIDHSLNIFYNKCVSILRKKILSATSAKFSFVRTQITQILSFCRNAGLRSKFTIWEQNMSKNIFSMKVLIIYLAFSKNHVQLIIVSFSFFMSQNTANFLSLVMPVLERLKVTVWEQ